MASLYVSPTSVAVGDRIDITVVNSGTLNDFRLLRYCDGLLDSTTEFSLSSSGSKSLYTYAHEEWAGCTIKYILQEYNLSYNGDPLKSEWNDADSAYVYVESVAQDPPTLSSLGASYLNSSSATMSIAVQGVSKIKLTATCSSIGDGTISYYRFYGPNLDVNVSTTSAFATYTTSTISGYGTQTYYCYAVDSNGNSSNTVSISVTVYQHSAPSFSYFTAYRSDSSGNASETAHYITCKYTIKYDSVNSTNKITSVSISYGSGTATGTVPSSSGTMVTHIITLSSTESVDTAVYNVKITATDYYGSSGSSSTIQIRASRILNIAQDGKSMGIGAMAPDTDNTFLCDWNAMFNGSVKMKDSNGYYWGFPQIQMGETAISAGTTSTSVTFSYAFSGTPYVVTSLQNVPENFSGYVYAKNPSSTGFTITSPSLTNTIWVYWIAIYQPVTTS